MSTKFLQPMLARIYGSRVDIAAEYVYRPPVMAQFPANKLLELRIAAARQALPANSIKPLRDLSSRERTNPM
jgi:hypothetical protein